MKKSIKFILLLLICLPAIVMASGSITVSPGSLSITEGGKATFSIKASNAAGRVDISSSNNSVATVSMSNTWVENGSVSVSVTAKSVGSATISVKITDAATFDGEALSGTRTVNVTVKEKPVVTPKSSDNSLKSISVEGYDLVKGGEDFKLVVDNDVTSITLNAEANDSKASVSGTGSKDLSVGENKFEIVVKAENGSAKSYFVIVTRKDDKYYLEDLDGAISDKKDEVIIVLKDGDRLTDEQVSKLKNSKKKFMINKYNADGGIDYTWELDSNNLSEAKGFGLDVLYEFNEKNEMKEKINYAEGIYFSVVSSSEIPKGIKLIIPVGSLFKDGDKVNVYSYDSSNYDKVLESYEVKDGKIKIDNIANKKYLVSMTDNGAKVVASANDKKKLSTLDLALIVGCVLLTLALIIILLKNKKNKTSVEKEVMKPEISSSTIEEKKDESISSSDEIDKESINSFDEVPIENSSSFDEVTTENDSSFDEISMESESPFEEKNEDESGSLSFEENSEVEADVDMSKKEKFTIKSDDIEEEISIKLKDE